MSRLALSLMRRIVRAVFITVLVGFFILRYAIRQYARKELLDPTRAGAPT